MNYYYFQRPDGEIPLDAISDVECLDDESEPYQFQITIEGRKLWKLKASSKVSISI